MCILQHLATWIVGCGMLLFLLPPVVDQVEEDELENNTAELETHYVISVTRC